MRDAVFEEFQGGPETTYRHGITYGGHPAGGAAGLANVGIMEREDLIGNSERMGDRLLERLEALREHPAVGDVRGLGLMCAIDLVSDKQAKTPLAETPGAVESLNQRLMDGGLYTRATRQVFFAPPALCHRVGDRRHGGHLRALTHRHGAGVGSGVNRPRPRSINCTFRVAAWWSAGCVQLSSRRPTRIRQASLVLMAMLALLLAACAGLPLLLLPPKRPPRCRPPLPARSDGYRDSNANPDTDSRADTHLNSDPSSYNDPNIHPYRSTHTNSRSHRHADSHTQPGRRHCRVAPSVVSIGTDFGVGSGVVIGEDGLILTALHVVEDAASITVWFSDGSETQGRLLGEDLGQDLALIKVPRSDLSAIPLADRASVRLGDAVTKLGYPSGYLEVSTGIISALVDAYRINGERIQITADVNPGDSGAPIITADGDLAGIVVAKDYTSAGVGFASPLTYGLVDQLASG